jgi:hypothetical protein
MAIENLKEFTRNWYENSRYGSRYENDKTARNVKDEQLKAQWVDYIIKKALGGEFISWKILNDFWNLDTSGYAIKRLIHDVPNGNFDKKWQIHQSGEKAVGWKKR